MVAVSLGVYRPPVALISCCRTARPWDADLVPSSWRRARLTPRDLAGLRVGIPGATTTAWLVLRLIAPQAIGVEIPIAPFRRIFDALDAGEVDAALLIHEGRMLYAGRGLELVSIWASGWRRPGCRSLSGVNVIRRGLGAPRSRGLAFCGPASRGRSPTAGDHRSDRREDRGDKALSDKALIDDYLNLYANNDTAAIADDARRAVDVLFAEARAAGLLSDETPIDWAP